MDAIVRQSVSFGGTLVCFLLISYSVLPLMSLSPSGPSYHPDSSPLAKYIVLTGLAFARRRRRLFAAAVVNVPKQTSD